MVFVCYINFFGILAKMVFEIWFIYFGFRDLKSIEVVFEFVRYQLIWFLCEKSLLNKNQNHKNTFN